MVGTQLFTLLVLLAAESCFGFVIWPPRGSQFTDANNTVHLILAEPLLLDQANPFQLISTKPLAKVVIETSVTNLNKEDIDTQTFERSDGDPNQYKDGHVFHGEYVVPFQVIRGRSITLNFTYFYCNDKTPCNPKDLTSMHTKQYIDIVPEFTTILGETDKPMYRPGDTIRFRFLALNGKFLRPSSKNPIWPTKIVAGQSWHNRTVEKIDASERERRLKTPFFDSIEVKDPIGNVVKQWNNVDAVTAFSLNYSLIADATEGEWTIVAKVLEANEALTFNVRHYVLPRFQATVEMPSRVEWEQKEVRVNVCASYTNGPPLPGAYDAQLCVCQDGFIEAQMAKGEMVEGNKCEAPTHEMQTEAWNCLRKNGILGPDACSEVVFDLTAFNFSSMSRLWGRKFGAFVSVEEEGTASAVVVSKSADVGIWPEANLQLELPPAYKHGLPIVGKLIYKNADQEYIDASTNSTEFELSIREDVNQCFGGWGRGRRFSSAPVIFMKKLLVSAGQESIAVVLPPMTLKSGIRVHVKRLGNEVKVDETSAPLIESMDEQMPPTFLPDNNKELEDFVWLKMWKDSQDLAIQVYKDVEADNTCPGKVELIVVSNRRLDPETPLVIQYNARGAMETKVVKIQPAEPCVDQDNEFGHYNCLEDNEIECLDGWSGENCLMPVCKNVGCGKGGICVAPDRCECKPGWSGESCETCIAREGCKHGVCVDGDDCVCNAGFQGWLCDTAEVHFEETDEEKTTTPVFTTTPTPAHLTTPSTVSEDKPRRTGFQHRASLELDGSVGPHLRAVAFVVENSVMAADYLELTDIPQCASPALAEASSDTTYGLKFDKTSLAPGEKVNMSIRVPFPCKSPVDLENSCLLSMSDLASKNFETSKTKTVDLSSLVEAISGFTAMRRYGRSRIDSTASAFSRAGLALAQILPPKEEEIFTDIMCPYFAASGPVAMAADGMVMERTSAVMEKVDKPRLRDFFPEVWLFDAVKVNPKDGLYTAEVTAPDSVTGWEANAVCFTSGEGGMWAPATKPRLKVSMPFFVEFTPPVVARRGEILHLPVSVFVYPLTSTVDASLEKEDQQKGHRVCYEVDVRLDVDAAEWAFMGASEFSTCICTGQGKETFKLPLRPLRMGELNVTATAVAKRGSPMCDNDAEKEGGKVAHVSDAVRRSVRVVPEGVPATQTIGGIFCTSGDSNSAEKSLNVSLPDEIEIVNGSLRSYVSISGNVLGKALENLDQLVILPTGCGEQNLAKVAPSVYVLQYLYQQESTDWNLAKKAAQYILSGYKNQLKYRHPDSGGFSTFGPRHGSSGSVWLTAYVFQVFSEAEKLPLQRMAGEQLNSLPTLETAFDFIMAQQDLDGDGCFTEPGSVFTYWMQGSGEGEQKLQLAAHVLQALNSAIQPFIEKRMNNYLRSVNRAEYCISKLLVSIEANKLPTLTLAKIVGATKKMPSELEPFARELISRLKMQTTIGGVLTYWTASDAKSYRPSRSLDVEATAHALLALGNKYLVQEEQLSTMRWLSTQQTENGGFYSTQDTVLALRALTGLAGIFPSPKQPTNIEVKTSPSDVVSKIVQVSPDNQNVAQVVSIGEHSPLQVASLSLSINSPRPVCVATHFTSFYNVPDTGKSDEAFQLEVTSSQGGNSANVECTTAISTVCLKAVSANPTGMLMVSLRLPSGWTVTSRELHAIPLGGALQRLEFNSEHQEVVGYFAAMTQEDRNDRCFTLAMHQKVFVENADAGLATGYDYYKPDEKTEKSFKLDSCSLYWNPPVGGVVLANTSTTPSPQVTPTPKKAESCPQWDANLSSTDLEELLNKSLCSYHQTLFVFLPYNGSDKGRLYSINYGSRLASWNATLMVDNNCKRPPVMEDRVFGFFGDNILPGQLVVGMAGARVVDFKSLNSTGRPFLDKLAAKLDDPKSENSTEFMHRRCWNRKGFAAILQKLSGIFY